MGSIWLRKLIEYLGSCRSVKRGKNRDASSFLQLRLPVLSALRIDSPRSLRERYAASPPIPPSHRRAGGRAWGA